MLIMYGPAGRNGKNVVTGTLYAVLGDLVNAVAKACVIRDAQKGFGSADNSHAAHLFTTEIPHLGIVSESDATRAWNQETLTMLTGDEDITAAAAVETERPKRFAPELQF